MEPETKQVDGQAEIARKLEEMARLQDALNQKVADVAAGGKSADDWREAAHRYYRAAWVECAELMDHYGWKWWKKQDRNDAQAKLELVDIWHFGLSDLLQRDLLGGLASHGGTDLPAEIVHVELCVAKRPPLPFPLAVEIFARQCLDTSRVALTEFCGLLRSLPMSFDELHRLYLAKHVLNRFRQAYGYADGSYRKTWRDGREDNEHLMELAAEVPMNDEFSDDLHNALLCRYQPER